MQAEQDLKKQTLQLTELNEKLNEYIEKYTRQAAYISQVHTLRSSLMFHQTKALCY